MKGADLEYRAKLVEIIYHSNHTFFEALLVQAVNNSNPHNYSAYIITKKNSQNTFFNTQSEKLPLRWKNVNYEEIRQFAERLFNEHTMMLNSGNKNTIEGVI